MALYILSGPQTNRIGLFLFSLGEASEDLVIAAAAAKRHLAVVCKAFAWEYDAKARVLWIPSWWTFNDPKENVKAFQGALTDLNEVPRTPLMEKFCRNLVGIPAALHGLMAPLWEAIGDHIGDAIPDPIGVGSQEQEQEQEQEKEQEQETDGRLLLSLWNDTVSSLPKAQAFSLTRLRHAKARLREEPRLEWWSDVIAKMETSDFLTGRRPSRDQPEWRADVDFLLRDGNAGKVLEGKYDNRSAPAPTVRSIAPRRSWQCSHEPRCESEDTCIDKQIEAFRASQAGVAS